ncbi:hypothetical protein [Erythrobacter litoralis]|uniref:hypothetical protein n=1 Tax=Erythrobacter litoralis TaxID=39960 RepID=UPI0012DE35C2|nr:hypothetical protein [Erythrobacter litoralis]
MTVGRANPESASEAWESVRADSDIQFQPLPPPEPPETPAWLEALNEFLADIFGPLAQAVAGSWPVLKWVLLAGGVALLLLLVWRIVEPYVTTPRAKEPQEEWSPDTQEALALLEDADRLADGGDFAGAVHLLLARSVGQIAAARPGLVEPSSTARELAGQQSLPAKARAAFAVIATGVERSLFALQDLGRDDWERARTAYSDFALERLA